ncbi:CO/xanthine dehydrogenase FAD-binding subunit [Aequitasia blattaphilus]|uniref:Xanthine dehydrogenase family protein subunit M n=1 Tax=Aequitasia blattaphilus TaxID=2949332 RepID=A0ABT1E7P6_9FIRM|nr:xanthine dehydrogenase family protein subunit M [Aequitasia blattaphilus]MCP1101850.1 xanthine dehydrogenase family protein subunit M [Aequitasia blattaphilus]MCR8614490.1 xanthine dehydrogenase family protein subunit M [Aequitasia blattaphilus]
MKKFTYHTPAGIGEALELLAVYKEDSALVAGGTDVVIELNERKKTPAHVIDISRIDELRYIRQDTHIRIGALNTFAALEKDQWIRAMLPALHETVVHVGSPQIRNLGTIGGNVVNASVAGDSPTTLLAYGGELVLRSTKGERVMTIDEFNEGPGRCQIRPDELLTEVRIPMLNRNEGVGYFKIGKRKSLAIVVLAVSIYIKRSLDNRIEDCRVVLGAVGKHPMRVPEVEAALRDKPVARNVFRESLPLFTAVVQKTIATRPSVVYKREGVRGAAMGCFEQILSDFELA